MQAIMTSYLEAPGGMKNDQELKKESFQSETHIMAGTRKIKDQNSVIFIIWSYRKVRLLESFLYLTGLNKTYLIMS